MTWSTTGSCDSCGDSSHPGHQVAVPVEVALHIARRVGASGWLDMGVVAGRAWKEGGEELSMPPVRIISDDLETADAFFDEDRLLIDAERLPDMLGWELKPEGLCRGDTCVPVPDMTALLVGGQLDLGAAAAALGRLTVVDADAGFVAIAQPPEQRRRALHDLRAPSFTLPDLDGVGHALEEWRGQKKLLVAFASW
jgi:hypothetical protein